MQFLFSFDKRNAATRIAVVTWCPFPAREKIKTESLERVGGTEDDGKFIRGNIARIRVKLENIKAKRMSNTLDGTFLFNPGGKN